MVALTHVAKTGRTAPPIRSGTDGSLIWVEIIKAVALIWIFLNHVIERLFGFPHFANPSSNWAPFDERLSQLRMLDDYGVWNIPMSLLRYLGWSGDQGVQLFLIISGFGLTWGLLARNQPSRLPLVPFYLRRAERIYPLWWGAHLLFIGAGMSFAGGSFIASLLGFRATAQLMYFYAPAWWYIGLLLQLYLVYPLLWKALCRWGPWHLLWVACAVSFAIRGAGLFWFDAYLDAWSRGAIFITRLPEFVTGICLAAWLHAAPKRTDGLLRSRRTLAYAVLAYIAGTALSLTLVGMTVAPYLVGVAVFVLLYAAIPRDANLGTFAARPLVWIGHKTYALFLVHDPIVRICLPARASGIRAFVGTVAAVVASVIVALALEWAVNLVTRWIGAWWRSGSILGVVWHLALIFGVAVAVLVTAELAVRRFDPQEVAGWGERASLEPHAEFGWRMRPSTQTRLRWQGYDYAVVTNSLGFPGPEYPVAKPPGTLRIFTVGDAYTSAEGVDTALAWPRLLEEKLRQADPARPVQVMNFAVTGYGPEQTEAVIREFVPRYRPDIIVYGFFVNEYFDVLTSNKQFQDGIGFGKPEPVGWKSILQVPHLRMYLRLKALAPLLELVRNAPDPQGYFLGNFASLDKTNVDIATTGRVRVAQRLAEIGAISRATDTRVIIAMIPAPVQVCGRDQLGYYPRHVDLSDHARFDLDQPQRLTREIAHPLGFEVLDMRASLLSAPEGCPYRGDNMHFTEAGQRRMADAVANFLLARPTH